MKAGYNDTRVALFVGISFLLSVIIAEFLVIMRLNDGLFVYTLDDPYIHMALSENIMLGHYGVNSNEFSAPSSSILWPFIIAPFSAHEYFPLFLNVAAAILTVVIFVKVFNASFSISDKRLKNFLGSFVVVWLILATNVIGLVFTGMEHSLQLLVVSVISYGLIIEVRTNKLASWLLIAVFIAPLIRYENLAISIATISYLAMRRYFKSVAFVMIVMVGFVAGFSLFLLAIGLEPFPTSVAVKSTVVGSAGKLQSIVGNLVNTLANRQGVILVLGALALLSYQLFAQEVKKKQLALVTVVAVLMHAVAGSYDWYNRYEIYILAFFILISLYFAAPPISKILEGVNRSKYLSQIIMIVTGLGLVIGVDYIVSLATLPIASNNVYQQQYQMHRFVVDYYKKPVAVNDLGYVSYKNNHYVLDLWGLGSSKALNYRKTSNSAEWMKKLTYENNVELAMIYEAHFQTLPNEWIKIGELQLGKRRVTAAQDRVIFYATSQNAYPAIVETLQDFIKTLPHEVLFTFTEHSS